MVIILLLVTANDIARMALEGERTARGREPAACIHQFQDARVRIRRCAAGVVRLGWWRKRLAAVGVTLLIVEPRLEERRLAV